MSNLRLLNETLITSSISSITVDNLFNDDFEIYKVIVSAEAVSVTDANLRLVNNAGSIVTTSNYDKAMLILRANSSFSELRTTSDDKFQRFGGLFDTQGGSFIYYFFNPNSSSSFTYVICQGQATDGGNGRGFKQIAVLKELSSISGINIVMLM
jgi:hypothetical protein